MVREAQQTRSLRLGELGKLEGAPGFAEKNILGARGAPRPVGTAKVRHASLAPSTRFPEQVATKRIRGVTGDERSAYGSVQTSRGRAVR